MSKADELKGLVPEGIAEIREFTEIYNTQGTELDNIYNAIDDVLNQCYVSTATWGLKLWEKLLGITTDNTKPDVYRRDVILSKMKGFGTVNVTLIDTLAESYDNGEISIIEHNDNYSFEVQFVGTKGIPLNIDDLKNAISEIKPAHLEVIFTFKFNTYQYLTTFTHNQLAAYTHQELREVI